MWSSPCFGFASTSHVCPSLVHDRYPQFPTTIHIGSPTDAPPDELSADPVSSPDVEGTDVDPVSPAPVDPPVVPGCVVPLAPPELLDASPVTPPVDPVPAPSVAPSDPESLSHATTRNAQANHEAKLDRRIGGE
ncbi:MAG: hypothetical protein ACE37F_02420 [Nannocystaceae bacterium]|nr:hypothetical protein [bacterium]